MMNKLKPAPNLGQLDADQMIASPSSWGASDKLS